MGEPQELVQETVNHRQWLFASLDLRAGGAEKRLLEAARRDAVWRESLDI